MPEICRFYGIVITVNYRDHAPPHFHVSYGDREASVRMRNPAVLEGRIPPSARRLVLRWARLHEAELLAYWTWSRSPPGTPRPPPIPPLE